MTAKLRLCFLIRQLNEGGAQRQLIELVRNLDRDRFDIAIVTFYGGGRFASEAATVPGLKLYNLHKRGRWDVLAFFARLLHTLRGLRPQVLHGYLSTANLLAVIAKPFLPELRIVWGVRSGDMDAAHYDWLTRAQYVADRWLARFADLIIINSHAAKAYHTGRGFPGAKCIVVPNGIDVSRFRHDADARTLVRAEWGIDATSPLIGIAARLDPMKDHATFLRAAALLHAARQEVRFVCIGGGPESCAARLHELANSLGLGPSVVWAGSRSDMVGAYSALDVLTLASSFGEGFPNVVAEAMACGVPCVVTDVGDAAAIVGDTGIVVAARNPEAIAAAWRRILDRPPAERESSRRDAHDRIAREFNASLLAARTAALVQDLVPRRR